MRLFLLALAILVFSSCGDQASKFSKNKARVGEKAPNITLSSPQGKQISLNDLKGKLVLVDFWASWCTPCRIKNPNWVRLYGEYNNANFKKAEGFEIFSISFDRSPENWQSAIIKDGLRWKNHVIDAEGTESRISKTYQVSNIPTNVIIDERGVIVGKNWKYEQIEQWLYDQSLPVSDI